MLLRTGCCGCEWCGRVHWGHAGWGGGRLRLVSVFLYWDVGVFIGMEKVCLLACRRCVYWHGDGAFIGMEGCVCWHGGGVFIGMEEVRLLGWRCVYWHGGGVFTGVEEVCFLAWRRCVI